MAIPQNYPALAAIWPSLSEIGLTAKMAALNQTVVTPETKDGDGNVVTLAVYWPEANGWQGTINENDLVVAGIMTDDDRKAWELNPS